MDSTISSDDQHYLVELLDNNNFRDRHILNPLQLNQINNKYYDTDDMSGQVNDSVNNSKLKVIHFNIHSLPDK